MEKCKVVDLGYGYKVIFEDGKTLLLQSDYDYIAFAVDCGQIPAPNDWDGCPSSLDVDLLDYDLTDITECPEEYYDQAD